MPFRSDLKLPRDWLVWRIMVRHYHGQAFCSEGLNLLTPVQEKFQDMQGWYPNLVMQRRIADLRDKSTEPQKVVVIDGNAKLARRTCGIPMAGMNHCHELNQSVVASCPCQPSLRSQRCRKHHVTASNRTEDKPQSEDIVAHKRREKQSSELVSENYGACLACKDYPNLPKRWAQSSTVTERQLREYWQKYDAKRNSQTHHFQRCLAWNCLQYSQGR